MRWIRRQPPADGRRAPVARVLRLAILAALLAAVVAALARAPAEEKHLTVFDAHGRYNVLVVDRGGHEYVALSDLLQPLGAASARQDGSKFRLRFRPPNGNEQELQLTAGKTRGKAGKSDITLATPFLIENGAPFVPLSSIAQLLTALGVSDIEFHPQGRRLLVGNVAIGYQTELQRGGEPKLVFHFSAPVDPTIATEPGKLRMMFNRAAVVGPAPQNFDDKLITSAAFSESNGEAEITINGTGPLMATFSPDARTITISPPPSTTAGIAPPKTAPAPAPAVPAPQTTPPAAAPPQPVAPVRPRFVVAIDAAHGGTETGAMLPGQVAEKDLTLAFARRLQAEFEKQGIPSFLVRDGDVAMDADQRAIAANTARAALFLSVHVGAEGRGVRVYTARMAPPPANKALFLPWAAAQSSFLDGSRSAAGSIAAEFSKRQMPVAAYSALLPPLNSIAGPAVGIEIAPLNNSTQSLSSPAYQQAVGSAVAAGVAAVRSSLEAAR